MTVTPEDLAQLERQVEALHKSLISRIEVLENENRILKEKLDRVDDKYGAFEIALRTNWRENRLTWTPLATHSENPDPLHGLRKPEELPPLSQIQQPEPHIPTRFEEHANRQVQ